MPRVVLLGDRCQACREGARIQRFARVRIVSWLRGDLCKRAVMECGRSEFRQQRRFLGELRRSNFGGQGSGAGSPLLQADSDLCLMG